jgi:hypothetical protein
VTVLAASSSSAEPGTLGFLVVAGMGIILVFLFRSMSKHLRKVNAAARRDQAADSPEAGKAKADAAPDSGKRS